MRKLVLTSVALCAAIAAAPAFAQAPPAYGEPINIETAKKAAAAAVEESKKHNWGMCVAVVGPSGDLVYFEEDDNCQYASIAISQHKARTAATYPPPDHGVRATRSARARRLRLSADARRRDRLRRRQSRWWSAARWSARSAAAAAPARRTT